VGGGDENSAIMESIHFVPMIVKQLRGGAAVKV
jgi:hypothetical protein